MAVAHYLEALDWQREFIKIHAILGGKNPHPQTFLVGGMAMPVDPDCQAVAQHRHDRAAQASSSRKAQRLRRPGLHPGPAGGRLVLQGLGGRSAAASATTSSTASTRRPTAASRRCSAVAASSCGQEPRRKVDPVDPTEDHRVRRRTPGTSTAAETQRAAPLRRRDRRPTTPAPSRRTSSLDTDREVLAGSRRRATTAQPMEVGPLARMLVPYASGHKRGARRWSTAC